MSRIRKTGLNAVSLLALAASTAISCTTQADPLFKEPDNIELRAMYCLTVLRQAMEHPFTSSEEESILNELPDLKEKIRQGNIQQFSPYFQRIRRFLLLRNPVTLSPIPMLTAEASAEADIRKCDVEGRAVVGACHQNLNQNLSDDCVQRNLNSAPSCVGIRTCKSPPSWLPY